MRIPKIKTSVLSLVLFLGAMPLFAQYAGNWVGEGYGKCPHPALPGQAIYPWQKWGGSIPISLSDFTGKWSDSGGNLGYFKGTLTYQGPISAEYRGVWGWIDTSVFPPYYKELGKFYMNFRLATMTCKGEWWTMDGSANGWMKGKRE
ncbi:hypothetical protein GX441_08605 [bacterium]|nr:hypothetical protein [bacterium]